MLNILLRNIAIITCAAIIILLPSFIFGPGYSDSAKYNFIWVTQFGEEMAKGHLYPRWLPDSFEGLGSPTFYFYPPAAYWVSGSFKALGLSTLTAINMTALIALAASGFAMHQWLAYQQARARLGAILYMAAPYHLIDFYNRGALAEFVALIWPPLIALSIHYLPRRRGIVGLALSYAGLILTHLPLAMLTSIFLIAPLAMHMLVNNRILLAPLIKGGSLGVALSAFYLLGAMTLQDHISSTLLWTPWYRAASWSILAPNSLLLTDCGLLALAVGGALLCAHKRSIWTLITLIAAANALGLIPFVWDFEPLSQAQFPWRLLSIVEFAGITALLRPQNSPKQPSPVLIGLGGGFVLFAYIHWIPQIAANLMTPMNYAQLARDVPEAPEYLPADFDLRLFQEHGRTVDLSAWRHLPRGDSITVTQPGEALFRRAAFPIWHVTRNGIEIPYRGPIVQFTAQPGVYKIERRLIWQEIAGAILSIIAALLLCALALTKRRGGVYDSSDYASNHDDPLPVASENR